MRNNYTNTKVKITLDTKDQFRGTRFLTPLESSDYSVSESVDVGCYPDVAGGRSHYYFLNTATQSVSTFSPTRMSEAKARSCCERRLRSKRRTQSVNVLLQTPRTAGAEDTGKAGWFLRGEPLSF